MKRVLLSTTALVAAGLLVTSVSYAGDDEMMMAEPISVGLGGYYHTGLVISASDNDTDRGHGINQNIELEVAGSTTLDNGITVSVRMRVNGNNNGKHGHSVLDDPDTTNVTEGEADGLLATDETEVNLSGGFGRIAYGTVEGATMAGGIWAPGGTPHGGVKSAWFGTSITGHTTAAMDEDALKISYYSPAFNGISFGVSYAPEDSTNSYAGRMNNNPGKYGEGVQSALNYSVDVMGGSFSANAGYETYASEDADGENATATRFGASLSIDQISVGGAVQQRSATGGTGERSLSDVGIGWSQGPLSLAVAYGADDIEGGANTVITALGAGYNLGPGIDFGAKFSMIEKGSADSTEVLLGTTINF